MKEQLTETMDKLRGRKLPITERELALLSYGVIQLEKAGRDPWSETLLVQVDSCFQSI